MVRSTIILCLAVGTSILLFSGIAFSVGDWESVDIGDNTKAGSTEIKNDVFTIVANGTDIWGTADECRYVYQETSGDFEISAHVVSQERADPWSKTGLMVRQSIDPGSQNAFINVTPDNGAKMIHRDTPGADTGPSPLEQNFKAPIWLKLVRSGDEFSSFWSQDGKDWEPAEVPGTPSVATVVMEDPVLVGIAVTSHASGVLAEAVVDNVKGGGNFSLAVEPDESISLTWGQIKANL
jgi:hypothetical protein